MTTRHPSILDELRREFPQPAWKQSEVVLALRRSGLGGERIYRRLKAQRLLRPLLRLPGAEHARYAREEVLAMIANALSPESQLKP